MCMFWPIRINWICFSSSPWPFSRTLLSNLNISLRCMRLVQHVSCNHFAPATAADASVAQVPAQGTEARTGDAQDVGTP